MGHRCSTCNHPEVERINTELALAPNVHDVAARFDIPRRTLARHRRECLTAKEIARVRFATPSQVEVDIAELARRGGETAVIGFTRLIQECKEQAEKCDAMAMPGEAVKYRKLQFEAYREQAKIAAIYPGKKTVNNNNLVISDVAPLFDMIDAVLLPYPEARRAVAAALSHQAPALEHQP